VFDALTSFSKITRAAQHDVFIVDAHLDETFLTDFASAVPEGLTLRLLADEFSVKPYLDPAATRWVAQFGAKRPIQARVASPRALHDRAIFVDGKEAWLVSQSFAHFVARSRGEFVRNTDTAAEEIYDYEEL